MEGGSYRSCLQHVVIVPVVVSSVQLGFDTDLDHVLMSGWYKTPRPDADVSEWL